MGASWRASGLRWPSLRGDILPMITLFPSQGDFCATAFGGFPFSKVVNEPVPRTLPLTCITCRACSSLSSSQGQPYGLPEVGIEERFFVWHIFFPSCTSWRFSHFEACY